ncbi:MAG: Holliday junction resolvase RuvX [Acidimicrobiales bacterium]
MSGEQLGPGQELAVGSASSTHPPKTATLPMGGRALGLDLGERRIGVAVSDRDGVMAFPRPAILRSEDPERDRRVIAGVVADAGASVVVVGLPLSLDGRERAAARAARLEAGELQRTLSGSGVRVTTWDERLTTVSAEKALRQSTKSSKKRRSAVDSAAATVLLQAWLDRQ